MPLRQESAHDVAVGLQKDKESMGGFMGALTIPNADSHQSKQFGTLIRFAYLCVQNRTVPSCIVR